MLSNEAYADEVRETDLELTCKIMQSELANRAEELIAVRNYRPAIAMLKAAQALNVAIEKYAKAFRIMNGEE